jgi:hypothetical protein
VQGNGALFTLEGWFEPEAQHTWTAGQQSTLTFRSPRVPASYRLEFQLEPFIPPGSGLQQRLSISVNFKRYGQFVFRTAGLFQVDVELPWEALAGIDMCSVILGHPDASRPSDHATGNGDQRLLAFAVRAMRVLRLEPADATIVPAGASVAKIRPGEGDLPLDELLTNFESLGSNCEFGILQRVCDAEPLGLFRFGGIPVETLIDGLDRDFEGLGALDNIALHVTAEQEYMVTETRYRITYHSWAYQGQVAEDAIRAREAVRLPFLHKKLLHDLASGEKIFVLADHDDLPFPLIERLHDRLQTRGRNTLLWVRQARGAADRADRVGAVEQIKDGLLCAFVGKFVTGPWTELEVDHWIEICRDAHARWSASR